VDVYGLHSHQCFGTLVTSVNSVNSFSVDSDIVYYCKLDLMSEIKIKISAKKSLHRRNHARGIGKFLRF